LNYLGWKLFNAFLPRTLESFARRFAATAPNPATNNEFTYTLARRIKRPALLPAPDWLIKILLGEMSQLILGNQRVIPERLLMQGFTFQYNNLADALDQALSRKYEQAILD